MLKKIAYMLCAVLVFAQSEIQHQPLCNNTFPYPYIGLITTSLLLPLTAEIFRRHLDDKKPNDK